MITINILIIKKLYLNLIFINVNFVDIHKKINK